jgi:hypothetical protein
MLDSVAPVTLWLTVPPTNWLLPGVALEAGAGER